MITASRPDQIALCASNLAYFVDGHGNYKPNSNPNHYANNPFYHFMKHLGVRNVKAFSNLEGRFLDKINAAIVMEFDTFTILAFRGTLPPHCEVAAFQDWINDLFVEPKSVSGIPGTVHAGIYDSYQTIKTQVFNYLETLKHLPLMITGHSKGGPMTSYAAYDAVTLDFNVAHVITFASPRPGSEDFAHGYNSKLRERRLVQTRYENDLDIVPLLPPEQATAEEMAYLLSVIAFRATQNGEPYLGSFLELLAGLFETDALANYSPVGQLQYISKDYNILPESSELWRIRKQQFINLFDSELPWDALAKVGAAHSVGMNGGYQKGVFPHIHIPQ